MRQVTASSRSSKKNSQLTYTSEWCQKDSWIRCLKSRLAAVEKMLDFFFYSVCVCACVSVSLMCITAAAWLQSCWCNNCSSKGIMASVNRAVRPFGICFPVSLRELEQRLFVTRVLQQAITRTIINTRGEECVGKVRAQHRRMLLFPDVSSVPFFWRQ